MSESRVRIPLKSLAAEPAIDSFGDCLPSRLKHHHVAHDGRRTRRQCGKSVAAAETSPSAREPSSVAPRTSTGAGDTGEHRENESLALVRHVRSPAGYGPRRT